MERIRYKTGQKFIKTFIVQWHGPVSAGPEVRLSTNLEAGIWFLFPVCEDCPPLPEWGEGRGPAPRGEGRGPIPGEPTAKGEAADGNGLPKIKRNKFE